MKVCFITRPGCPSPQNMKLRIRRRIVALTLFSFLLFLLFFRSLISRFFAPPQPRLARIAYFIQVSPSNLSLLSRLLATLYNPSNHYALHLDLKIPPATAQETLRQTFAALSSRWGIDHTSQLPNIYLLPAESVTYRGSSMTLNYLSGSNRLLAEGDWDFFINLSGADYPTASQLVIRRLLGRVASREYVFVEWKPRATWEGFARRRMGEFYIDTALAKLHSSDSQFLNANGFDVSQQEGNATRVENPLVRHLDYTIAKTSGWFILPRSFCEHLRDDSDARKLLIALSYSDASDEHYFGTVLWNAGQRWSGKVVGSNMRSIFFVAPNGSLAMGEDGVRSRQHPFRVDEQDDDGGFLFWDELKRVPGFFTRKVEGRGVFRDRVDREMIGLGELGCEEKLALKEYEDGLESRFDELVRAAEVGGLEDSLPKE